MRVLASVYGKVHSKWEQNKDELKYAFVVNVKLNWNMLGNF